MAATKLKTTQLAGVLKQLVAKQGGKCAICKHPFTLRDYAVADHCHTKGFIRGALHNSCNGIEGRIKALAQRGHTGISSEKYVIGLGAYLAAHVVPQYQYIHPSHKSEDDKRLARNKKARLTRAKAKAK